MPTATANGKKFNFPDGTSPEQMGQAIDEYFASAGQQVAPVQQPSALQQSGDVPYSQEQTAALGPQYTPPAKPERTMGDRVQGGIEALGTVATGATGGTLGYLAGTGQGLIESVGSGQFGTPEGGQLMAQRAQEGASRMTYKPTGEAGQEYVQAVGEAAAPLAAFAPMAGEMAALGSGIKQAMPAVRDLGKIGTKQTDNRMPVTRAPAALIDPETGYISKEFANELKRQKVTIEAVADDIPRLSQDVTPRRAVQDLIVRKINARDRDGFLATKQLTAGGQVVDDQLAQEAIRQGFRDGDVQAVKMALPGTKKGMAEMVKIRRAIYGNERKALDMRPSDVIGNSALKRVDYVRSTANSARNELDSIARTQLAGKQINSEGVASNFFKELDKLDVEVDTSTVKPRVNFAGSMIAKDRTSQKVINDVIDLLAESKTPDALRAHKLKRQLDAMIDFRKQSAGGLTESGRNVAKSVRKSLNDAIREQSTDYARVNDVLSSSIGAMDDFERAMGPSINIWDEGANRAIGQDLRSLMSNNKSRVRLENALSGIDDTARELGGLFDDDIKDLVLFDKTLDEKFGAVARRGFSGEIESGVSRALEGKAGLKKMAVEAVEKKASELRNVNDAQAFRTLEQLLNRQ